MDSKNLMICKMYKLEIEIMGLPQSTNARSNTNYRSVNANRKLWHENVFYATVGKRPKFPLEKVKLTLVRHSSVPMDYDGIVASFKPVVDGLIHAEIIVDDTMEVTGKWDCDWKKAKAKRGKITIKVEEIISLKTHHTHDKL